VEEESLSLAWVKNNQSRILAVLEAKSLCKLWLCGFIQETEVELDTS
jgi:hypothetical protein